MKKIYLALFLFIVFKIQAQNTYEHELIVKFNPTLVNNKFVNDISRTNGQLKDILPDSAIVLLSSKTGIDMHLCKIRKVFPQITIADSFSITRNGDTIIAPAFWATFVIYFTNSVPDNKTEDILNDIPSIIFTAANNIVKLSK